MLVVGGSGDDRASELVALSSLVDPLESLVVLEGFLAEVLIVLYGRVQAVGPAGSIVKYLEDVGSVLIPVDESAEDDREVTSVSGTAEALSDDTIVVELLPEVTVVVGGDSEEDIVFSEVI